MPSIGADHVYLKYVLLLEVRLQGPFTLHHSDAIARVCYKDHIYWLWAQATVYSCLSTVKEFNLLNPVVIFFLNY